MKHIYMKDQNIFWQKKKTLRNIIAMLLLILACQGVSAQMSGAYTIDSSTTTGGSNYQTFNAALSALKASGVNGKVTFTVKQGTYREAQMDFTGISGASTSNSITFDGGSGNASSRVFRSASTSTNYYVIRISNLSGISFKNLSIIDTANINFGFIVQMNGSTGCTGDTIKNCILNYNGQATSTFSNTTLIPILLNGSNTSFNTAGVFTNCYVDSNTIDGGYMNIGIFGTNATSVTGNRFTRNVCLNARQYGIYIQGVNGCYIDSNSISMNADITTSQGIYINTSSASAASSVWSISKNKIINMGQHGIYINGVSAFSSARGLIANNMIGGGFRNTNPYGMFFQSTSSNWDVFHNTINIDVAAAAGGSSACLYSSTCCNFNSSTNLDIRNNIFAITNSSAVAYMLYHPNGYSYLVPGTSSFNYNLFYYAGATSSTVYMYMGGSNITQSQIVGNSSYNTNSVVGNPMFYSNTDLRIADPSRNVPQISSVTVDRFQTSRGSSTDMGAQEAVPVSNDLGVTAITSPSFPMSAGTQNVVVTIKNYGSNTVTSANVSYTVNGGSPVTFAWTGSVAAGATTNVTFSGANQYTFASNTAYNLRAYTGSPNGSSDGLVYNDTFTASTIATALCGTNYTIDNNIAASSTNFTSFSSAFSALNLGGITCPVYFTVNAASGGMYYEQATLGNISGANATNTITFDGGNGNASTRVVSFRGTVANNYHTIRLDGSKYVRLRNLTFRSADGTNGWPLHIKDAIDCKVQRCLLKVDSAGAAQTNSSSNLAALVLNGSNSSISANSSVMDSILVDSSAMSFGYYGIAGYGVAGSNKYITISNNTIDSNYQYGTFFQSSSFKFRNNIVRMRRNGGVTTGVGCYFSSCLASNGNYLEFSGNTVLYPGQYGVYFTTVYNTGGASASPSNQFYNNMIGGGFRATGATACAAFYVANSTIYPWNIYNNTFYCDAATTGANRACYFGTTNGTTNNFQNNIFALGNSAGASAIPFETNLTANITTLDYNDYYSPFANPTLVRIVATDYKQYNFNTAFPNGGGANSLNLNPQFNSTTTMNLRKLTKCLRGVSGLGVSTDIDGYTRAATPNMGADEVQSGALVSDNVGVDAIVSPSFGFTPSATSTIKVRIKNFGSNSVTSCTVSYNVNGGSAVSQTFSGLSLNTCDTATVTFTTTASITSCLSLQVYTSAPNGNTDGYLGNDSLTQSIIYGISGSYTINPAGSGATNFGSFTSCASYFGCGYVTGPVNISVSSGSGTYYEQAAFTGILGTTATNKITFDGGSAASTIISMKAPNSSNPYTLRFDGCNNINLRNMTVRAVDGTNAWALHLKDVTSFRVAKCNIKIDSAAGTATTSNIAAVALNGNNTTLTTASTILDSIYIDSCYIRGGYYGVLSQGQSTSIKFVNITNSTIDSSYFYGTYFVGNPFKIKNNIVSMKPNGSTSAIGSYFSGCIVNTTGYYHEYSSNKIYNAGQYGVQFTGSGVYNSVGTGASPANQFFNNMIGGNFRITGAVQAYGFYNNGTTFSPWNFFHNSINMDAASTSGNRAFYTSTGSTTNVNFQNNVFAVSNVSNVIPAEFGSTSVAQSVTNNNYYNANNTNLFKIGATSYTSSALTTAFSSNGGGTGSVNNNPNFTGTTDLHTSNTSNDGANLLSNVGYDIDGHTRINPPDMGADEVQQTKNVGVTALVPTSPVAGGTQNLKIRIKNFGSASQTNIPCAIHINGALTDTFYYTGTLASGDSALINFTNTFNFTTCATVTGRVYLSGDTYSGNDSLTVNATIGLSGTYTIDTSASASGTNFKSFNSALLALTSSCYSIAGPIVFNVSAHTYGEQINIPLLTGVSATNTVTFNGSGTSSTILTYATTNSNNYVVRLNSAQYINFRNMAIKSSGTTDGWIVHVYNAKNCNISKCLIEFSSGTAQSSTGSNLVPIVMNNSTSAIQTSSSAIDNINVDSSVINYGYYNTYMYISGGTNPTIRFRNDTLSNAYNTSIYMYINTMYHKILNNKISLRSGASNQFGIWSWASPGSDNTMYSEISNNWFTSLNGYGIALTYGGSNGSGSVRGQIYNNVFGGNTRGATTYLSGAAAACCAFNTWSIYNNTFYLDYGSGTSYGIDMGTNSSGSLASIKNNVFYNASSAANNIGINLTNGSAIGAVDYNNFYTNYAGGALGKVNGNTYTASNYRAAYPNGLGLNSLNRGMTFTSSTDYHHSTACLSGQSGLGVTLDLGGTTRPTPPGMGAYEPSGIPANDIGVMSISTPAFPVSAGSQPVSALVKNFGTNAVSSMTVYYSKNGGAATSQSFSFSPSLNQCDTATVTFSSNVTISSGSNVLKVYTALVGDAAASNDTAQGTFCPSFNGNYTIDSSIAASSTNFTSLTSAVSALVCGGVAGPVKFTIAAGTYSGQVDITAIPGASSTKTIQFIGSGTSSTFITASTTSTTPYVIRYNGCQYVYFRNMAIKSSGSTDGWIVHFMNAVNCSVSKCLIEFSNGTAQTSTGGNLAGVVINGSATTMSTISSAADNIAIDSNNINYGYYNIYLGVGNNTTNPVMYVRGDSMTAAYYASVIVPPFNYVTYKILNNRISLRTGVSGQYALNLNAYAPNDNTKYDEISGNKMTSLNGVGIGLFGGGANGGGSVRGQIYNNVLGGSTRGATNLIGASSNCCSGYSYWNVYHNTFILDYTSGTSNGFLVYNSALTALNIKNNIFYNTSSAANNIGLNAPTATGVTTLDYNDYYTAYSGGTLASIGGTAYTSSNYKAAYSSGAGANSINNPVTFVSSTDFHHSTGCLNGQSGLVATDYDGTTRNSISSMGAFEVSGIPARDVSVYSITNPSFPITSGANTISAVIKNSGTDTLQSVTAYYTLNGGAAVSQTFNFSPALNQCDTITVNFSTQGTINTGSNSIKVYVVKSGDANAANDTAQSTLCTIMSGAYTINPIGSGVTNYTSFTQALSALNCAGMNGAITFTVYDTTYNESFSMPAFNGNNATNTITFTSASGNPALCKIQGVNPAVYTVQMAGVDYTTFNNIGFLTSTAANARNVEFAGGSTFNTFNGCIFNSTNSIGNYHIYENAAIDNYNTFTNNTFNAVAYAFSSNGNGTRVQKWVVQGNTFNNQYQYGLNINYSDSIKIINNTFNTSSATTYNGIYIINSGNAIQISGNTFTGIGAGIGINIGGSVTGGGTSTTRVKIYNNVVRCNTGANASYGIAIQNNSNIDAYHNTIYNATTSTATSAGGFYCIGNTSVIVQNNILYCPGGAYAFVQSTLGTLTTNGYDYNDYYTTGTNVAYWNGTNYTTLANWKTGVSTQNSTTGSSAKSQVINFVSAPTNLSLPDGCLTGVSGTGITTDILGASRASTPNLGAYEFSSLTNNIQLVAVRTPAAPFSTGLTNVVVTIKNVGSNTVSSDTVYYQYDNNTPIKLAIGTTMNPCDTLQLTFNSTSGPGSSDQRLNLTSGIHYLKAYSAYPNASTDNDKTNDTVGFTTCTGGVAGTFTIDSSQPASTTNFKTFAAAVSAITSCGGISGAVTFNVKAGTYNEQVDLAGISGLTATNTITFDGGTGNAATRILQASGNASLPYTIRINNLSYITIKNMTIRGTSGNAWPVHILGSTAATYNTVKNCIIDFGSTPVSSFSSTGYMGVVLNGSATSYSTAGVLSNNLIDSNTIQGGYANIIIYSTNTNSGSPIAQDSSNAFTGNACNNAYQYGISVSGINGGTIDRNTINMNTNLSSSTGILVTSSFAVNSNNSWSISKNKITNMGQYGIYLTNSSGYVSNRGLMANNLIGGGFRNTTSYGIYMPQTIFFNWNIFHNTINLDVANATTSAACYWSNVCCPSGGSSTLYDIRNNIFAVTGANSSARLYIQDNGGYGSYIINTSSFDYNVFYHSTAISSTVVASNASTGITYSQVVGNNGYNSNSVVSNPFFTSSTDLHIGNAGNNAPQISPVTTDYSGASRGSSTDIGAYEKASPGNDIAITAMTAPTTPLTAGNNNIVVTLKNNGSNQVTSASISYRVNTSAVKTVSWTGTLNPGNTASVTFNGANQYNFSADSLYTIVAYSSAPNAGIDSFMFNDTFTSSPIGVPLCGNYTINQGAAASSTNFTSFTNAVTRLNAVGVSCPVYFTVLSSTPYNEQVELLSIAGASTTNTITFDGGAGNAANRTITFAATSQAASHTIRINNTPGVTLRNLTIQGTGTTYGWPVHIYGNNSDYCKVKSCIVNFGGGTGATSTSSNFIDVLINGSTTSYSTSASIDATEVDSNTLDGGFSNIMDYGPTSVSTPDLYTNNTMTNAYQYGLQIFNTYAFNVSRNTITGRSGNTVMQGIYLNQCFTSSYNSTVSYNTINNCGQYGVYVYNTYGNASTHFKMYNNMIGGGFNSNTAAGVYGQSMQYWDVYYNSINMDYATTAATGSAFYGDANTNFCALRNNVFTYNASGSGLPAYMGATTLNDTLNYNDYYNSANSNLLYYNAATRTSATYTSTGGGANSINVNPSYTSSTNLRHSNTSLKAGTPITSANSTLAISSDIDGHSRNATTPYIGVYEVPFAYDLAANLLLSPTLPSTAGTFDVRIKFKNLGANNVTSGTVGYIFNGGSAVTSSYSGTLVPLDTTSVNFTGGSQITIAAASSNTLKIFAVSASDGDNTNDTLTYSICPGISGNYTIDTTQAASSTNFKSFGSAINAISGCGGIAGPVVFNVSANTYTEQVNIGTINGASATNTVTFQGADTTNTILTYLSSSSIAMHTLLFNSTCQYVTFRNMKIRATGSTYAVPVYYNNASNNNVRSCVLEINNAPTSGTAAGVVFSGSISSFATAFTGNNNYIDSNRITGGYYNLSQGSGGTSVNYIRNNKLQNASQYGISVGNSASSSLKIIGNTFEMATGNTNSVCIWYINGGPSSGYYHEVKNNIFLRTGLYHIFIQTSQGGGGGSFGQIYNNFFGGVFNSTGSPSCISMYGSAWNIYHNSFYMTGTASGTSSCFNVYGGTNTIDVRNNILANMQTGGVNYAADINNSGAVSNFNNNMLYSSGTYVMSIGGAPLQSSSLIAAFPSGAGLNSLYQAPSFVSTTDLHISQVCNNGANLGVTTDIDGQPRPTSPDMGADEAFANVTNDVGVYAITTPNYPLTLGSNVVKVKVKNYGTDTFSNITVNYSLNGGAAVTQTFALGVTLYQCDTTSVTFSAPMTAVAGNNNLKVYTNKSGDANSSNDTAQINICPAMSGTYTIDAAGSGSTNFASFTLAAAQLNCGGVSGPVVFNVATNVYTESIALYSIMGSSATNTITFQAASGVTSDVTLQANSPSTQVVLLNGADYVRFRKMTITNNNASNAWGIVFNGGANYNIISNCNLIGTNTSNANGIVAQNSTDNFNLIDSNTFTNGYNGIFWQSNTGSRSLGNIISNNIFTNQYQNGMYLYYHDSVKIRNNVVTTNQTYASYVGINVYVGFDAVEVTKNKVYGAAIGTGMSLYIQGGTGAGQSAVVANNMIQIGSGTNLAKGIDCPNYSYYTNFYHNTVNITSGNTSGYAFGAYHNTNVFIKNNIFANSGNGSTAGYAYYNISGTAAAGTVDYNDYYTAGTNLAYYTAANQTTLANWFSSYNTINNNSKNIKPDFVSTSDLHIANKGCMDNFGTNLLTVVGTDYDNASRSATPDFGADEFTANTYDVALQTLITPASTSVTAGSPYTVKVRIKNMGTTSVSSVTMNFDLNGSVTTETFTPGAALAACDTATYTYTATVTFPSGTSTFKVYSGNINGGNTDLDHTNDTIQGTYCGPYAGVITVDPAGTPSSTVFNTFTAAVNRLYNCGIGGPVTVQVADGIYNESIIFSGPISGSSPTNTLTFVPKIGDTGVWVKSTTNHVVYLDGAKYVTFDGRPGSTGTNRYMHFYSNNGSNSAVYLLNDAIQDTIRYCNLYGNSGSTLGTLAFGTTSGTNGNDSNTVEYCNILPSSSWPANAIYAQGTASKENGYVTIRNNNIINFGYGNNTINNGIYLNGNNINWNILNNNFTNTASILNALATTTTVHGIQTNAATEGGHLIQGNRIGGSIPGISGSMMQLGDASLTSGQFNTLFAIRITSASASNAMKIYNNNVSNIKVYTNLTSGATQSTLLGILTSGGLVEIGGDDPATGNIIGDTGSTRSLEIISYNSGGGVRLAGVRILTSTAFTKIKHNVIGGLAVNQVNGSSSSVSEIVGIQHYATAINQTCYIDSNHIGNVNIDSSFLNATATSPAVMAGIWATPTNTAHTHYIRSNQVSGFTNNYTGGSTVSNVWGIMAGYNIATNTPLTSTASFKIDSNDVRNLRNYAANTSIGNTASIIGIGLGNGTTQANPEILRNTVTNLNSTISDVSIYGIFHSNTGSGSQVSRNSIYSLSNSSTGGTITNISGITNFSGSGVTFANNQVSLIQNGTSNNSMIGISDNTTANTQNYHYNSIYIGGTQSSTSVGSAAFGRAGSGSTLNLRNNIFFNEHTSLGTNYLITIPSAWSSTTSLYNYFVSADTSNSFYISGTATTRGFASWKANVSDGTGSIANNTLANPSTIFFSNKTIGDLHIISNYCEVASKGTSVATTNDIDGQTRSATPVIGADEFNSVVNSDLGISSIASPISGTGLTAAAPVLVYIKNFGVNVIPNGTNYTLGYRINGGSTILENTTLIGTIVPGDSISYTYSNLANISTKGTYNFKAWINGVCDADHSNDTAFKTVIHQDSIRSLAGDFERLTGCIPLSGSSWIHLKDNDSNLIMSINPNGNNMGATCYGIRKWAGTGLRLDTAINDSLGFFLDRNFYISPTVQPSTPVSVRLYVDQSELQEFVDSVFTRFGAVITSDSIRINKYHGPRVDLDIYNNDTASSEYTVIQPTLYVWNSSTHFKYFEFNVNTFSELNPGLVPNAPNTPLPISLVNFDATKKGADVELKWNTSTEWNSERFDIERSINGIDFNVVGSVSAAGMSTSPKSYRLMDLDVQSLNTPFVYYRLKEYDFNGKAFTSDIRTIGYGIVSSGLVTAWPNPANDQLNIRVVSSSEQESAITVLDLTGKIIQTQAWKVAKGSNQQTIDIRNLAKGVYMVKVVNGNQTDYLRIVKQ